MDVLLIKKRKEKRRRKDCEYLWESLFQKKLEERNIRSSCLYNDSLKIEAFIKTSVFGIFFKGGAYYHLH